MARKEAVNGVRETKAPERKKKKLGRVLYYKLWLSKQNWYTGTHTHKRTHNTGNYTRSPSALFCRWFVFQVALPPLLLMPLHRFMLFCCFMDFLFFSIFFFLFFSFLFSLSLSFRLVCYALLYLVMLYNFELNRWCASVYMRMRCYRLAM